MRTLIAEDEYTSRRLMESILSPFGPCRSVANGEEAVGVFAQALSRGEPFDLVCMDIMMPVKDGQEAVREIREIEAASGVKPADEARIIMTTALGDPKNVVSAYYRGGAASYVTKPIDVRQFLDMVRQLGLIT